MGYMTDGLTFNTLRQGNLARVGQFKNCHGEVAHTEGNGGDWTPAQWLQATVGEVGEYANLRKKFERGDVTADEFLEKGADELADIVIYLDLLAYHVGIDLGEAVTRKFNRKSREQDIPVALDAEDWHQYVPDEHHVARDIRNRENAS